MVQPQEMIQFVVGPSCSFDISPSSPIAGQVSSAAFGSLSNNNALHVLSLKYTPEKEPMTKDPKAKAQPKSRCPKQSSGIGSRNHKGPPRNFQDVALIGLQLLTNFPCPRPNT